MEQLEKVLNQLENKYGKANEIVNEVKAECTSCDKCTGAMFGDDECERCKGGMFG